MHPSEAWGMLFDFADILSTSIDQTTGTLTAQLGDVAKDRADSAHAEVWQLPGVCSRPALPTAGNSACQALVCKGSDRDVIIATRDTRANAIYGNLKPGDSCIYSTSGQARGLFRADGSARLMTTNDNTAKGATIYTGVSPYFHGIDGQKHLGGEWRYYAPWGGQWHDPQGYHLRHTTGGASARVVKIDATTIGVTLPVIGTVAQSWYAVQADVIALGASSVQLGVNDGTQQALVMAQSLQTLMGSYASALGVFATALTTFLTALEAYTTGIAPVADNTPPLKFTTPLNTAAGVMQGAAAAFANSTAGIMAGLALTTGTITTTAK